MLSFESALLTFDSVLLIAPIAAGEDVGLGLLDTLGDADGFAEGEEAGVAVGVAVGEDVGVEVGLAVGVAVGLAVGVAVGRVVGVGVGAWVGVGEGVGVGVGACVGVGEGVAVVGGGVGVSPPPSVKREGTSISFSTGVSANAELVESNSAKNKDNRSAVDILILFFKSWPPCFPNVSQKMNL